MGHFRLGKPDFEVFYSILQGESITNLSGSVINVIRSCGEKMPTPTDNSKNINITGLKQDTTYSFWIIAINQKGEMGATLKDAVSTSKAGRYTLYLLYHFVFFKRLFMFEFSSPFKHHAQSTV